MPLITDAIVFDETFPYEIVHLGDQVELTIKTMPFATDEIDEGGVLFPPVPTTFFAALGAIHVQWAQADSALGVMANAFYKYNDIVDPLPYQLAKRLAAMRREAKKAFQSEALNAWIEKLCAEAAEISWQRNIMLHGSVGVKVEYNNPSGEPATERHFRVSAEFVGKHKGEPKALYFTMGELRSMFYEISSIAGRADGFLNQNRLSQQFSSDDISQLQDFRKKVLPTPPTDVRR